MQADSDHEGHWSGKFFEERRTTAAVATIALMGKGKRAKLRVKKAVVGFKTPWVEFEYATLSLLFGAERPTFFYCVRNLRDNYLSARAVLSKSPETYLERARQSLETALKMMDDPNFSVHVLCLDQFLEAEDKGAFLAQNLFVPLPVARPSSEAATAYLGNTSNRNATVRKLGKERPKTLPPEVRTLFADDHQLERLTVEFEHRTGIDLRKTLL